MTKPKSAGTVIVCPMGKDIFRVVCIVACDGRLQFPKGKREAHERPEDTAVRETYEETGLRVRLLPHGYLGSFPYRYSPADFFFAVPCGGDLGSLDRAITKVFWWNPSQLQETLVHRPRQADQAVLGSALRRWKTLSR